MLVAGHLDTVWSHGTLDGMPYQVNGEKAHGPGIYDMKAGSFLAFHAVRSILQQQVKTNRPIVLLLTPDEEVGSPTSREWIEREASQAAYVLIPEPAGHGGACVTARKGVGRFVMRVEGRGAHSGGTSRMAHRRWSNSRGRSCGSTMVDLDRGITLNAAPVWGGSRPNVISPDAGCEIDLRVNSVGDGVHMERMLLGNHGADAGMPRRGGGRHEPAAVCRGRRHSRAVRQGARDRRDRWGSRCRGSIAAADRTAISPRRWVCRRSMDWAVPARARTPATSTYCGSTSRRARP